MPAISKTCAICDMVFPNTVDITEIVRHSASCVHSFCEKSCLDLCMCISCSGHQKPTNSKRSKLPSDESLGYSFAQVTEFVLPFLEVPTLKDVATLNSSVFAKAKLAVESRCYFTLKGSFIKYNPKNVYAKKMADFIYFPSSAKKCIFRPGSKFNEPIDTLPDVVSNLQLGKSFDQIVSHWPASLTQLSLDSATEALISSLPSTIKHLTIAHQYDSPVKVPKLPASLVNLYVSDPVEISSFPVGLKIFSDYSFTKVVPPPFPEFPASVEEISFLEYNHPITLPPNLVKFCPGSQFNQPLAALPQTLQTLDLTGYSHKLPDPLPPKLTHLHLGDEFDHPLPILPSSLEYLHLGAYSESTQKLPRPLPNLTYLNLSNSFEPDLPASLLHLHMSQRYTLDLPYPLPPNLKTLTALGVFNHPLKELPPSLEVLWLSDAYNHPLGELPNSITELKVGNEFNHPITNLPASLTSLELFRNFRHPLPHPLPVGLTSLQLGSSFKHQIPELPPSLKRLCIKSSYTTNLPTIPASLKELELHTCVRGGDSNEVQLVTANGLQVSLVTRGIRVK